MSSSTFDKRAKAGPAPPKRARSKPSAVGPSPAYGIPAIAFFALFALLPMVIVVWLSLQAWSGIDTPTFTGLTNWTRLFSDPVTLHALWLSVEVMVLSWVVQTPISILLGVYLAGEQRHRSVLAILYMLPLLLSSAAVALTWRALLDPNFGGVTELFSAVGLGAFGSQLLSHEQLVLFVIVMIIGWQFIPLHTLLYRAAVRQIPSQMFEAALIDGASKTQQFFSITLPQLKNTVVTSTTLMLVGSLTYFDVVFILTKGGPGNATRLLPLDMYLNGFQKYDLGYASAIALVLAVAGIVLSLLLSRLSGFGRFESDSEGA